MKKRRISLIIGMLNSLVIVGLLVYIIVINNRDKTASDIFNMNVNSVVEVKATTESVGESYGSGVIYDSSGLLITNAHVIGYTSLWTVNTFVDIKLREIKNSVNRIH